MNIAYPILQWLALIALAPLWAGLIHKSKQRLRGQQGIPIRQYYFNLWKLLHKEVVRSNQSSFVSNVAPYIVVSVYLVLIGMLPAFFSHPIFGPYSDMIVVVYLLAMATFFMTLYALDQGSAFGGLGSSREWLISILSEPTLVFILLTTCFHTHRGNLAEIWITLQSDLAFFRSVPALLSLVALILVTLAENARIPFDNPETHLELTMIHEACILEASGRHLASFEFASYLKLSFFLSLLSMMIVPFAGIDIGGLTIGLIIYITKMMILVIILACVEILNPKLRLFRVPIPMSTGFVLSLLAMLLTIKG